MNHEWMTTCTSTCIQQGQVLPTSIAFIKYINRTPTLTNHIKQGFSSLWGVKELIGILQQLVGKSPHHIQNTLNFVESIKDIKLQPGECITSYYVTVLFTSVPIEPTKDIIKNKLWQYHTFPQRPQLTTQHIIELLQFCLKSTYFLFQGK